ncbi:MAG: ESX secretion-associated protein EspG, partial [Sciscionella sp.]
GRRALLGVLEEDIVELRPVDAQAPEAALVRVLPAHPPARVRSVSLPKSELLRDDRGPAPGYTVLRPTTNRLSPDAADLKQMLAAESSAKAQLYVAVRDRHGRRTAEPRPINFVDTPGGRILLYTTCNRTGEEWINARSCTADTLIAALQDARGAQPR